MSNLKPIRISRCVSHLYCGLVSFASRSQDSCISSFNVLSPLHPGPEKCNSTQFRPISNSFWSQDVCFTSIHVLPHQLPGPKILVLSPSMYRLISIQVQRFLSHFHPCTHFHLGNYICISPPNMSRLAYNQAWVLCLAFIQVTFNWHVGHKNSQSQVKVKRFIGQPQGTGLTNYNTKQIQTKR